MVVLVLNESIIKMNAIFEVGKVTMYVLEVDFCIRTICCKMQEVVCFIRFSPRCLITSCIAGNSCNLIEQLMAFIGMFGFSSCVNLKLI